MSIYKIGYIIKQRREELHYTQEELAEGICSVTTLSRIENGERLPSKDNFEMLFQRLGISDTILFESVDENTLYLHELKFKIRQAVINYRYAEAQELIGDYAAKTDMDSPVERQFVLINSTLANKKDYSPEERLSRFEEAILLTCPKYTDGYIPRLLTYEEIIILNNIAGCYHDKKEYKKAIIILSAYTDLESIPQSARLAYCFNPFAHVTSLIGGSFGQPMLCDPFISAGILFLLTFILGALSVKRWYSSYAAEKLGVF